MHKYNFFIETAMSNNFKVYVGVVLEDKALNSRELKVFIREITPFASGEMKDNTRVENFAITNTSGEKETGKVNTTNNVTADYFGLFTNRSHPPDMVKGEQVIVLQYADEDRYYWVPTGRDDNLRKTEILRLAVSNDSSESKTLSDENTYFLELDTKLGKRIRIATSKSSGEPFGYSVIMDAGNSFMQLSDDKGNRIEIISQEKQVKLTNQEGGTIDIKNRDINIFAPGDITMRSGGTMNFVAESLRINGAIENEGSLTNKGSMTNDGDLVVNGAVIANQVTASNIK